MTMKNHDLMVVADAFFVTRPLIRAVSLEGEDVYMPPLPCVTVQQDSTRLNLLNMFDGHVQNSASSRIVHDYDDVHNKENYMAQEDDDLRRTIGSNDYDCNDTRDAPEDDDDEMERDVCHDFYHPSRAVCKP